MKVSYSAPAKVILSGEHVAVYGKPAIASAVNLRFLFTIADGIHKERNEDKIIFFFDEIVINYLKKNKINFHKRAFTYDIESQIPIGRGMGSSGAFSVAAVSSLLHFYTGKEYDLQTINSLAYLCEKYFHGIPSGLDSSTSCFGGLIFYRKEFEFLRTISSLNFKIPQQMEKNLYLIDSGMPEENTGEMVKIIGKKYNKNSTKMNLYFNEIERLTKRLVISIVKEDKKMFRDCIKENEKKLESIGIVSPKSKKMIKELETFGVGKVTGAGGKKSGSGYILFYVDDENGLIDYLNKNKISFFSFQQSKKGLLLIK